MNNKPQACHNEFIYYFSVFASLSGKDHQVFSGVTLVWGNLSKGLLIKDLSIVLLRFTLLRVMKLSYTFCTLFVMCPTHQF